MSVSIVSSKPTGENLRGFKIPSATISVLPIIIFGPMLIQFVLKYATSRTQGDDSDSQCAMSRLLTLTLSQLGKCKRSEPATQSVKVMTLVSLLAAQPTSVA